MAARLFGDLRGIDSIYCSNRKCSSNQDWLVKEPTSAALWILGSLVICIGLFYLKRFRPTYYSIYKKESIRIVAVALGISMYLRAALTLSSGGDKPALYIGSMVLNYSVGLLLYNSYCVNVVLIRSKFQPPSRTSKRINYGVSFFHLFGSFGVLVCGTVLMFHPTPDNPPAAGLKCLQVILVFVIVVTLVIVFSFAYRFKALRKHMSTHGVLSTIIVMFLVILWASFMLARLCVDLNNPARSSEALFFLLNYVPLILGILATLMLGEPVSGKINYDEGSQLNELQTRKEYDNQNTLQHPKIQKPSDNVQPVNGGTKRPFDA